MAQERKAKIASRVRDNNKETPKRRFSTRPEDIVRELGDGWVIAKDSEGGFYKTERRFIGAPISDPNRYGRPSARLTAEEVEALAEEVRPD